MEVERTLNLVHTTESLQRAKDAMGALPPGAGDDFSYDDDSDGHEDGGEGGDEGPSTSGSTPSRLFSTISSMGDFNLVILREYQKAANEFETASPDRKLILSQFMASLQLQKLQFLQQGIEIYEVKAQMINLKDVVGIRIDHAFSISTIHTIRRRM